MLPSPVAAACSLRQPVADAVTDRMRLAALSRTALLDTPPEPGFDRLTALVRRVLGVPVALVSLVDRDRQFFKSQQGLTEPLASVRETPLSHSFCQHVVATGEPLQIEDARLDARVCHNPAIADFGVIAYLGVPLHDPDGHVLGTLCAIDERPRAWSAEDEAVLRDLAAGAESEIALQIELAERERSEARYRVLFEALPDAVLLLEPGTETVLAANGAASALYGFAPGEMVGTSMRSISDNATAGDAVTRWLLADEANCRFESVQYQKDGTPVDLAISASVVPLNGRPVILSVNRDVTEQKQAEAALRASRAEAERLALIAARITNGVIVTDADGQTEWVNEGFQRLSGYTLDDMRGRRPGEVLRGPETDPAASAVIAEGLARREPFAAELVNHRRDGTPYWVRMEVTPLFEAGGTLSGFISIEADITERRQAEDALRESEARFRLLTESATDVILTLDASSVIEYINPAAARVFGYAPDELIGGSLDALMPDGYRALHHAGMDRYAETGERIHRTGIEVTGLRKDGSEVVLAASFGEYVLHGERRFTGILRDITVQKAAEAAERAREASVLHASQARYDSVVDAVSDAVLETDLEGRWLSANPAWTAITGHSLDETIGQPGFSFFHPDDVVHLGETFAGLVAGTEPDRRLRARCLTRDRGVRSVEIYAKPRFNASGAIVGIQGTITDITDTLRLEAERQAREKVEEALRLKNSFLNNMSHEIRTPLTGILGFAELLEDEVAPILRPDVQVIVRSARRLQDTLNSILDLARLDSRSVDLTPEPVDVLAEAHEAVRLLQPVAAAKGLALVVTGTAAVALADPTALHQVLNNLIGNAVKFTDHGVVSLSVESASDGVILRVEDTGSGIDPAFVPHLFDEFRQASSGYARTHEGNGLGLAITKRLVDLMGATIEVESVPGAGSTFTVVLPVPEAALGTAGTLAAAA